MKPYYEREGCRLYMGDTLDVLREIPDDSIQCVVTSPPYWGLRDYGIDGQLGLEATPAEYVSNMVAVFSEIRRVLKPDGTLWLNLGDTYATGAGKIGECPGGGNQGDWWVGKESNRPRGPKTQPNRMPIVGLKPKDLCGIPWRVALALQSDGWYLRSDIIWSKPNPMPESVTDRPTKAHEYIFLMTKSEKYYYDAQSIKEPCSGTAHARGNGVNPKARWKSPDGWDTSIGDGGHGQFHKQGREKGKLPGKNSRIYQNRDVKNSQARRNRQNESFSAAVAGLVSHRNKRTVWTVATHPYPEAHFATYPPDLIKPCILAGSRSSDVVLDPFNGSGTTGEVAIGYGRHYIGIDINADYLDLSIRRIDVALAQGRLPLEAA